MSETGLTILEALLAFIGGGTITTIVAAYLHRRSRAANTRRTTAEAEAIESDTRQSEVDYYRTRVEQNIKQMERLEAEVVSLKKHIENIQGAYEQRVGELHRKIDRISTALDTANQTIGELRREVKEEYTVIAELRSEITQLLVDRAAKSE